MYTLKVVFNIKVDKNDYFVIKYLFISLTRLYKSQFALKV